MKPSSRPRYSRGRGMSGGFSIDPVLAVIGLNVVVFLISFFTRDIAQRLGLSPYKFTSEPWTLITSMFLHTEFFHIFSNMLVLFFFGRMVYRLMGGWRFLVVYFVGGIAGNLLFLAIGPEISIAYGASGAVYAIAGTLVVLMPKLRIALWGIVPLPLWAFVVIFLGLLSIPPFAGPNIAWQAHMGGLAVGLIAGFIFRRQTRHLIYR